VRAALAVPAPVPPRGQKQQLGPAQSRYQRTDPRGGLGLAVADFDVLRDKGKLRDLVAALGGDFGNIERNLTVVTNGLKPQKPLRKLALEDELKQRLAELPDVIDEKQAERLRAIIKAESGWDRAKQSGIAALPQGEAGEAAQTLLADLKEMGLLVVPVGELERFVREVPGHGPGWVVEVLERELHRNPGPHARSFVESIRAAAIATAGGPHMSEHD
jgi:hypothetical protein